MIGNHRRLVCALAVIAALLAPAVAAAGTLEKAQAAAEEGKWAEAAQLFGEVLDETAGDRTAALGLSEAAIKAKASAYYHVAEDSLLRLRDKNSSDVDVRIALGEISLAIATTKSDTLALKSYHAEAQRNFEAALKVHPKNERAAVGLARSFFETAFFQSAADAIDRFLASGPQSTAKALYWKGQAYYFLAQDEYRKGGSKYPLSAEAKTFFQKAQGAYHASAKGDESSFEAWMQYAYASQYLGDRNAALEGYRKAVPLDQASELPLRGLEVLFGDDKAKLSLALQEVADANPKHEAVLYYFGKNRYDNKDYAAAIKFLKRHVAVAKAPGRGWYWLGMAYDAETEEDKAVKAYGEALKANPDDSYAAWQLENRIRKSGSVDKARSSVKGAKEVIKQYAPLLKMAPRNVTIRNNLALQLRDGYERNGQAKKWIPILKEATRLYVEASDLLGEWTTQKENTLNREQRYGEAQVISDTGLMFQFYEPTRDYEKAEMYYNRALEYSSDSYPDAFINLAKIYTEQKRWQDLYDLADVACESTVTRTGQPDMTSRNLAKKFLADLKREGKVKD